jgi:hypothetical protein
MIQGELAGYADYAAKVRYRLIPSVWYMLTDVVLSLD